MKQKSIQVSCAQMCWGAGLDENLFKTLEFIRQAAKEGSRVVCFPEASLTGYYFPRILRYSEQTVLNSIATVCKAAKENRIWAIVGAIIKTSHKYLNIAYVISPEGEITHEYAKVHLAGKDEKKYCRAGDKLSLFEIDGVLCTLAICRDGRHPEVYRIPAMAGAQILFHPSCSTDDIETVAWKRISGRAQIPAGPTTKIFHCVANTVGQSPDGLQTSSGGSFIRDPSGLPLIEASFYKEELITAVLNLNRADRSFALDSLNHPPFLKKYWEQMILETKKRANIKPE
ncbi:MAG: carbon-nitrogen hydrolase family protein [Verrucomicrobiia bacterium]|jgi:predicted amidohydrolase